MEGEVVVCGSSEDVCRCMFVDVERMLYICCSFVVWFGLMVLLGGGCREGEVGVFCMFRNWIG